MTKSRTWIEETGSESLQLGSSLLQLQKRVTERYRDGKASGDIVGVALPSIELLPELNRQLVQLKTVQPALDRPVLPSWLPRLDLFS